MSFPDLDRVRLAATSVDPATLPVSNELGAARTLHDRAANAQVSW
jgi:hypothetical protein